MSDIDVHEEFDRLDTGISDHPDLAGLWAGGQRRRRRTRAIWTAGALATAAVVAPLALLVGGGNAPQPTTRGFASVPTAVTTDEGSRFDTMRAAVFESFPPADGTYVASSGVNVYNDPIDGEGLYWLTEAGVRLTAYAYASGGRLPCPEGGCEQVDNRNVVVVDEGPVEIEGDQGKWVRTVQVFPTDPARTDMLEVSAAVSATSRGNADTKLPSTEALIELALDERLSLLVDGGGAPEPTAAPTDVDPDADLTAAVTEVFPDAQLDASRPGAFTLANGVSLQVRSGPARQFACDACSHLSVGDQEIWVGHAGDSNGPTTWSSIATTTPVSAEDGSAMQVEVEASFVTEKESEGRAQLPADEVLAELAADVRMKPESGWTEQAAGETAALAEMSAAIEERLPGLHTSYARHGDVTGTAAGERVVATERMLESEGAGSYRLYVWSGSPGYLNEGRRTDCHEKSTPSPTSSCTQVGDMTVHVTRGQDAPDMSEAFWSVSVYPTDPSRMGTVQINAFVEATSWEEAEAKLPSVETLTELALDERLAPPTE